MTEVKRDCFLRAINQSLLLPEDRKVKGESGKQCHNCLEHNLRSCGASIDMYIKKENIAKVSLCLLSYMG